MARVRSLLRSDLCKGGPQCGLGEVRRCSNAAVSNSSRINQEGWKMLRKRVTKAILEWQFDMMKITWITTTSVHCGTYHQFWKEWDKTRICLFAYFWKSANVIECKATHSNTTFGLTRHDIMTWVTSCAGEIHTAIIIGSSNVHALLWFEDFLIIGGFL